MRRRRFVLAPEAALDLATIWRHLQREANTETADRVEAAIRQKIVFLASNSEAGHARRDLTDQPVKFFPVYSYLIVYRPKTKPLQVVAVLHGSRDVQHILRHRF